MPNIGTVSVGVDVDASGVPEQVRKSATRGMESIGNKAGELFGRGLRSAATATAAAAGTLAVTAFVKGWGRLSQLDTATTKLKALGNAQADVDKIMSSALKSVKGTAFSLDEAASAASMLAATKVPLSRMDAALGAMVSTAGLANIPLGEMSSIFTKVAGQGKLTGETLLQLGDRSVPVLANIAEYFGITQEAAHEMVSKGKIDFETFIAVMGQNADAAKIMGTSFSGMVANVGAAAGRLGAASLGPVFESAKLILPSVITLLDQLTSAIAPVATALGERLMPYAQEFADWLAGLDFAKIGEGASALAGLAPVLAPLGAAFLAIGSSGIGNALAGIPLLGRAAPILQSLGTPMGTLLAMITALVLASPELRSALGGLLTALVPLFVALAVPVGELAKSLMPLLVGAVSLLTGALSGLVTWIADGVRILTDWMNRNQELVKTIVVGVAAFIAARAALNGLVTAIVVGVKVVGLIRAAWTALSLAFTGSGIGLIITLVAALVAALVYFFTQTKLGKEIVANVVAAIGAAFTWLHDNVIKPVVDGIVAAWNWLVDAARWMWENALKPTFDVIGTAFSILGAGIKLAVDLVVNYFRFWAAVAVWVWEHAIQPALDAIGKAFTWVWETIIQPVIDWIVQQFKVWGVAAQILYAQYVQPVFDAIAAIFSWIWANVIQPVIEAIKGALDGLGKVFRWLYDTIVKPVFDGISNVMKTAWLWIDTNVFTPFKTGIDLLAKGFEIARSAIEATWKGIKKAAADPINFVLDTIWNNGLRSFWNDMVTELGLKDMKLPKAPLVKFARGGVLPGYTPGRDVHQFFSPTGGRLALSGGEGIIRPDALRRLGGKRWLDAVNRSRGRGDGLGLVGDVWDTIQKAASVAWDFISDPAGAIQKHVIDGIIRPLLGGQNVFGQAVGGLAINTLKGFTDLFKKAAPSGAGKAGMGWRAMWDIISRLVPGATLNSAFRPGAKTVNGGQSYHALGRAVDIGPATMAVFTAIKRLFPNASELIFTPAGGQQLRNGRPTTWPANVAAQHWDHIHLAMKNGGIFDKGGWMTGLGMNTSGKPEAVFTAAQFAVLERNVTQMDTLLSAVRGYRTVDLRRSQASAQEGMTAEGRSLTIEAGAFALSGPDPYKVSLLVADRIAEKVGV